MKTNKTIMDSNEKKPKRPRIGENRPAAEENEGTRFEKPSYNATRDFNAQSASDGMTDENRTERTYGNNRPYNNNRMGGYNRYNNQGGYQQRQGGYNRYNNYNQGGYQPRPRPDFNSAAAPAEGSAEGENAENTTPSIGATGYQPRQGGYNNRQGGYQPRQGGYNNRQGGYQPHQGGYDNRQGGYQPRQGGYNNRPGGYQQRPGGYNNQNRQGGYQPRQGGYNNRQGGYNNRPGGYNDQNRQGGYQQRQGGYNNRRQGQGFNQQRPGKSFTPRPKRIEYEMPLPDPDEQIRLNKFMANAGICSRREADEFIQQGLVKVNGNVVTELGTKISHSDVVEYDEKVVALESKCYILLNKPKDCVTTSDDPNGRLTVMDLVKGACSERIYPVGRLDRNTTGVLLLTNDGDLASRLTHPKYVKKKIYHVWCDKDISEDDMQRIADGIELEDGPIHADAISYATENDRNQAGIEIHSGRNRIVRRIFESLGYHVTKLDRVYFAGLTKKNLPRGRWRYLTQEEVNFLKMGSFE